ncbi:LysM peptidoglycan-binding domain-containing M23 family metallopeptidase [Leptospira interrogans]|uniref:Peptidase, M23 family n=4 Tax=Leptospira interrogans TaxID=173 RepID=A0A0F6HBP4_LEPIR|nr:MULTISPECIES: M23 family metallopeptidase [Leptospira]EMF43978.1 peptidase, M23 family [Leptospira interrogans serovar Lora str. TE 1992]AJR16072.1 M23 family metalloendopeptidase [Leptospira interrogans serovar Linhai str. 56609]AKH78724.1 peptidase M23 [Leptospira interrogans serovar Bratislava]ASV07024.1 peptidase M23 [Leptospira interrogans serovar Canicola]EJO78751.1 peptidase, M23 family [Leptospira interrogans serovar Pomona str. Kennewicki LC82-25]
MKPSLKYPIEIVLFLFTVLFFNSRINSSQKPELLKNLDYNNQSVKRLREDIKNNLKVSISNLERSELTSLEFYRYIVKKEDNFFKIMARTGMDIDTISSVNSLASPYDIYPGMELLIPNMRGVYDSDERENSFLIRKKLSKKYKLAEKFISFDEDKKLWFIPGKGLPKEERSFFYGVAFYRPLGSEGIISSRFGKRKDPFTRKETFHGGLDMAAEEGTPVYASADGEVYFSDKKGGYGNLIILGHKLGYETLYGHLSSISVRPGEKVHKGQKIGEVGQTGRATGNHLHFEVRRFNQRQKPIFRDHV